MFKIYTIIMWCFISAIALAEIKVPEASDNRSPRIKVQEPLSISGRLGLKFKPVVDRVELRGFGPVSAEYTELTEKKSSVLVIHALNAEKARLLHAVYQSDLKNCGGVKTVDLSVAGRSIWLNRIEGQGVTISARRGVLLYIISSEEEATLLSLLKKSGLLDGATKFSTDIAIPTYLQSWSKYPFRFYYRTWELPKGADALKYDYLKAFDFAAKNELGFSIHSKPDMIDLSEGLNNVNWNSWVVRILNKRNIPFVITPWAGSATWFYNRFREQTMMKMPDFCGSYHAMASPYFGGTGRLSWTATTARDMQHKQMQDEIKRLDTSNLMEIMEPNSELKHGMYDMFLEYGAEADKSYRLYLQKKYTDLETLGERWYGDCNAIKKWQDIRVPEIAEFTGYGKDSISLKGTWHFKYELFSGTELSRAQLTRMKTEVVPTEMPPDNWFLPEFDDSGWAVINVPGNDISMFVEKRPTVYRRFFDIPSDYRQKYKRIWLYVWDLNIGMHKKDKVIVFINGEKAGEETLLHNTPHWMSVDISSFLKDGRNHIALRIPKGYIGYKIYLAPVPPRQYPDLGKFANARWVDFSDWRIFTRIDTVRRGVESIRGVDADKSIYFMAPNNFAAGIKKLCEEYGGHFHNTGYMGAFWAENLPMLMRSSRLPFSLEPGAPAKTLDGFKKQMGLYLTEGVNAIHYFIHVGDILWHNDIRSYFQKMLPALKMLGKSHIPQSDIAMLFSFRANALTEYPWFKDFNTNLPSGYFAWKFNEYFLSEYQMDAVCAYDFKKKNVNHYKVIIDTNSSIMDNELKAGLKKWISDGGVFVTFMQTGRHLPEVKDAWPIEELTGYKVTGISHYDENAEPDKWRKIIFAPGQKVFDENDWDLQRTVAHGLTLEKKDADCEDLIYWTDGGVAAGIRKLGKGYVINLGLSFCRDRIWRGNVKSEIKFLRQVIEYLDIQKVPAHPSDNKNFIVRHAVANNGLYDVWNIWNRDDKESHTTDVFFGSNDFGESCKSIISGKKYKVESAAAGGVIKGVTLPAYGADTLMSPRKNLVAAGRDWFELKCNWWRGTKPSSILLPEIEVNNTLALAKGWKYKIIPVDVDPAIMAASDVNDTLWDIRDIGTWIYPDEIPARNVIFRKTFLVPKSWNSGQEMLWLRSSFSKSLAGNIRVWLDGVEITSPIKGYGVDGLDITEKMRAGKKHCIAVAITGDGQVCGLRGNVFISHLPEPDSRISLAGKWTTAGAGLVFDDEVVLPGKWNAWMAKRYIEVPDILKSQQVYLYMETSPGIIGVLINGHWLKRYHHCLGKLTFFNMTPWIKFGKKNEVILVRWNGKGRGVVDDVELWVFKEKQ